MANQLSSTALLSTINSSPIPKWRIGVMRALFFLNFISLAFDNWSAILFPEYQMDTLTGVSISFWAAFSLLNLIALVKPLKFVPILLLQLIYKSAWIIGVFLPAKNSDLLDEDLTSFLWVCIAGIVLNILIIPWKYAFDNYLNPFFPKTIEPIIKPENG